MRPPLVVWQFTDGKPGHESQTRGLIAALKRRVDVHAYRIPVESCRCGVASLLRRRHPCKTDFPPPDLILACGRSTHFAALAARRACGGRLISLMKPPLPLSLYDLALIPRHDGVAASHNVHLTRGVLNPIVAEAIGEDRRNRGLFLIGGPSAHHRWKGRQLVEQVTRIVWRDPDRQWTLTTSRRTPPDFVGDLCGRLVQESGLMSESECVPSDPTIPGRLVIVPVDQTPPGWVAEQLRRSDAAVVTDDSVSMVYESLSAGVAVSLIEMPRRGRSRVMNGVEQLMKDGLVSRAESFLESGRFSNGMCPLAEADRCTDLVLSRWFAGRVCRAA